MPKNTGDKKINKGRWINSSTLSYMTTKFKNRVTRHAASGGWSPNFAVMTTTFLVMLCSELWKKVWCPL